MGNKIREFRKKKLMSQEELAEKSGISRTTISMLENNPNRNTSTKTMKAIALALGATVEKIFFSPSD